MKIEISPEVQRLIEARMRSGRFESPEAVIRAGLLQLEQDDMLARYSATELRALLADGERSLVEEGEVDLDTAIAAWRERRGRRA